MNGILLRNCLSVCGKKFICEALVTLLSESPSYHIQEILKGNGEELLLCSGVAYFDLYNTKK
jgi:hypothetical protein